MSNSSSRHIFEVLRFVSTAKQPVSVKDVAHAVGLATTTAHRALATLEETDYVSRYESSARYVLGPMVQGLLESFFSRYALRDLAIPYMRTLALLTGESISLMVPVGWYCVRIALVRGVKEIIHTGPLGEVDRLTGSFASLAILATYAPEQIDRALAADPLRRGAPARDEVVKSLAQIRSRGYSSAAFSANPDFAAVAVPLRGNEPTAIGALAIEGPVAPIHSDEPLPIQWLRVLAEIEIQVRANPRRFQNPYAHLDPDTVVLDAAPS